MLSIIRQYLQKIIDDIDAGNSELSEDEEKKVIDSLRRYSRKDGRFSKYQAYTYLNISRATFDRYVKEGLIPKGKPVAGCKELFWSEREIRRLAKTDIHK